MNINHPQLIQVKERPFHEEQLRYVSAEKNKKLCFSFCSALNLQ